MLEDHPDVALVRLHLVLRHALLQVLCVAGLAHLGLGREVTLGVFVLLDQICA